MELFLAIYSLPCITENINSIIYHPGYYLPSSPTDFEAGMKFAGSSPFFPEHPYSSLDFYVQIKFRIQCVMQRNSVY